MNFFTQKLNLKNLLLNSRRGGALILVIARAPIMNQTETEPTVLNNIINYQRHRARWDITKRASQSNVYQKNILVLDLGA